jgi:hypothetical protein
MFFNKNELLLYCKCNYKCPFGYCRSKIGCFINSNVSGCLNDYQKCNNTTIQCCFNDNYCNNQQNNSISMLLLILYCLIGILAMIIIFFSFKMFLKRRSVELEMKQKLKSLSTFNNDDEIRPPSSTISNDIKFIGNKCLNKGRFGCVWSAIWKEEINVAVKVFSSFYENSWRHETTIYKTSLLKHDNILTFIGSDIDFIHSNETRLILITEYHRFGSLYDYLKSSSSNQSSIQIVLRFIYTIISGIDHLHCEINSGYQYKSIIAHCDLKSKNILVKNNLECCLCDFGNARRYNSKTDHLDFFKDDFISNQKQVNMK